jgi:hypothetical protein
MQPCCGVYLEGTRVRIAVIICALVVSLGVIILMMGPQPGGSSELQGSQGGSPASDRRSREIAEGWLVQAADVEGELDVIGLQSWTTPRGELVAALFFRYAHVDLAPTDWNWQFDVDPVGPDRLVFGGQEIDPRDRPQVWVNGPYGRLTRVRLDATDGARFERTLARLASAEAGGASQEDTAKGLAALWEALVARRLYTVESQVASGGGGTDVRVIRLEDGTRYMRCSYVDGKRHGKWTLWRPDGTVLAEGQYVAGRRHGQWTTYDAEGKSVTTTQWQDDRPVGRAFVTQGPFGTKTLPPVDAQTPPD